MEGLNFLDKPDFMAKYGPLLHILDHGEDDWAVLATRENYQKEVGRKWRDTHCEAVLGYMRAIRTDYEVLWQQTSAAATRDPWLGAWLGNTERQLRRLQRRMWIYVMIQKIAPIPSRKPHSRAMRRFLLKLLPKLSGSEFRDVLVTMRQIHQRGGATVYLP